MASNPFADLIPNATAAPPPGAIVVGTPRPEKPKEPPSGYRWGEGGSLIPIPGGPADKSEETGDPKLKEAENTAAFLATRLAGSLLEIQNATKADPSAESPSLVREAVRGTAGQAAARYITPAQRQIIEDAQLNALDAALTLGTGAAYNKEQLLGYAQSYFPQVGDTPKAIEAKRQRFKTLLEAAKVKAGNAAPKIDEALMLSGAIYKSPTEAGPVGALGPIDVTDETPPEPKPPSGDNVGYLLDSAKNIGAGLVAGPLSLPDMLAQGAGQVMAIPLDMAGLDEAAAALRNTPTFGAGIEALVPTPQDWNGWSQRKASEFIGGAAALPARATNALADIVVGKVPARPPSNALTPYTNKNFMDEANALGIEPMASVVGGPATKMATATVAQTAGGVAPIVGGARRMAEQGSGALNRIARQEGEVLRPEAAGEAATAGALKWRNTSRLEAGKVYDKATQVAGDTRVNAAPIVAELEKHIAHYREIPLGGSDNAKYIEALRDELVQNFPEGVTVAGVRGMRTTLREKFFREGLRGTELEMRVNEVVDSVSKTLASTLEAEGKGEAAILFRQADKMWKDRAETLDNIIMPIIGKKGEKSGTQVMSSLQSAMESNGPKLQRFLRSLPKEEAGDTRATLIHAIGKAKAGAQNAEDDAFSFATLLTNWSKASDSARKALFNEGDREAMDKLVRISSRIKDTAKYSNFSNTGGIVVNSLMSAGFFANPVAGTGAVAGTWILGKALASPGVARIIARVAESRNPTAAKEAISQLTGAAARNPAAANDILALQQRLLQSIESPATAAAAKEQEDVGQK